MDPPRRLSLNKWLLTFGRDVDRRIRRREVAAGDLTKMMREIDRVKKVLALPEATRAVACYEAGRDGFWISGPWMTWASGRP